MSQKRKYKVFAQYLLVFLGLVNLALGLYFSVTRDYYHIIFTDYSTSNHLSLIFWLISFLGVVLSIQGVFNIFIALKCRRSQQIVLITEFLKGTAVILLSYVYPLPRAIIPLLYLGFGVVVLVLMAELALLKAKFTKDYLFCDKK